MAPAAHTNGVSPSAAHRCLSCPASFRLERLYPNLSTVYADKGTLAHAIAELKARYYFGIPKPMTKKEYNAELRALKKDPLYEPSMDIDTDQYLDCLKELALSLPSAPLVVALEQRVDASKWAQDCWGTADCIILGADKLCIVDYKNGVTPVSAEHNPQLMIYALGALSAYEIIVGDSIKMVSLTIVQPNSGGVKTWELPSAELLRWGDKVLRPGVALAMAGTGEAKPDPDPDGYCKFCRARHACRARTELLLSLESDALTEPKLLSDAELADALRRGAGLVSWYTGLKEYTLAAALSGRKIPGYKVVEGRGSRDWKDLDTAFETLRERGVDDAVLWERKPASVAGLEKTLGKKSFATTAKGLWEKKPGKPALVEEEDPRSPYNAPKVVFTEVK